MEGPKEYYTEILDSLYVSKAQTCLYRQASAAAKKIIKDGIE